MEAKKAMEKMVDESSRSKCTTCGNEVVTGLTREALTGKEIEIKLDPKPACFRVIPSTSGMLAREDRSCLVEHKPFCRTPEPASKDMQSPKAPKAG